MVSVRLREHIETLPDAYIVRQYLTCVELGYTQDKEIVDLYEQHAHDRLLIDHPIHTSDDVLKYFDEVFPNWENNSDLREERKKWEEDPWGKFRQSLDEMGSWCEYGGCYFVKNYEY